MSCHSFLHAVRYGNIIIGVYTGGSGSTELFCVRLARRARPGLDEKHQHPVPLSGPWEWLGMSCWAVTALVGKQRQREYQGDWDREHIWSEITIVQNQWHHLFNALFQFSLSPIFFLQRHYRGSLKMCEIASLLLQIKFTRIQRHHPCFKKLCT